MGFRVRDWPSNPTVFKGKSLTRQSEAAQADVNKIVAKFQKDGSLERFNAVRQGRYGDFSGAMDYLTALSRIRDIDRRFEDLPSNIRNHFDNDPAKMLEVVEDPARHEELRELGLLPPGEQAPVPQAVQEAPPPPEGQTS